MVEFEGKMIHSVEKAIQILDVLADVGRPMSLTELYARLGWPKSTIHGLLTTMRVYGLTEQDENGRYRLGLRLFEYGCTLRNSWDTAELAKPYMEQAREALQESVFLSVYNRGSVVTLAEQESRDCLRVVSEVGARLPIHCTSQGKLFLAYFSQAEAKRILRTETLKKYTPDTITEPERFLPELEKIRRQGYAVERGEFRQGLQSISVPVRNASGEVAFALGCVGLLPAERFTMAVQILRQAAEQLSRALGYR